MSAKRELRRAIIPAAGFGTRFLPFSKAVPKEMIPLVDKPVIQYVVEEAVAAGITEILIVTSAGKEAIFNHFIPDEALNARLAHDGKTAYLRELEALENLAHITFMPQLRLRGLGDAVLTAREFAGDEACAVLLGDTVLAAPETGVTAQLARIYRETGESVVAVEPVPREKVSRYGIISGASADGYRYRLDGIVEKPAPESAPSNLAVAARYIFHPEIFAELARTPRGRGGEIQLTDAMASLLRRRPMYACKFAGRRHDIGNKLEFLKSTVAFGLERAEFREEFAAYLKATVRDLESKA